MRLSKFASLLSPKQFYFWVFIQGNRNELEKKNIHLCAALFTMTKIQNNLSTQHGMDVVPLTLVLYGSYATL